MVYKGRPHVAKSLNRPVLRPRVGDARLWPGDLCSAGTESDTSPSAETERSGAARGACYRRGFEAGKRISVQQRIRQAEGAQERHRYGKDRESGPDEGEIRKTRGAKGEAGRGKNAAGGEQRSDDQGGEIRAGEGFLDEQDGSEDGTGEGKERHTRAGERESRQRSAYDQG